MELASPTAEAKLYWAFEALTVYVGGKISAVE